VEVDDLIARFLDIEIEGLEVVDLALVGLEDGLEL
jgi:hypothetical protein